MTESNSALDVDSANRRECFRINDRVGLSVEVLSDSQWRKARSSARDARERRRTVNALLVEGEHQKPFLRKLRNREPDLAEYVESVELRLHALARALQREASAAPDTATHDVNISGTGIRFNHHERLAKGTRVQLDLHLFPTGICLRLHGTVVWSGPARAKGRTAVAVDYSDVPEEDRELLIKHIHGLQMDYVRRGVRRD